MAESDDRLARSYRALGREEPPPSLDAVILAAARESVRPRARNRWAGPLSIAAVLVLGLGISLRMQVEQPGIETSVPSSSGSAEYPAQNADTAAPPAAAKEAPPEARERDAQPQPPARAKAQAAPADEREKKNLAPAPPAPPPPQKSKLSRGPAEEAVPAPASPFQQKDAPPPDALAKERGDARPAESARAEPRPFAEAPAPPPAAAQAPPPRAAAQSAAPASPAAPAASPAPLRAKREAAAGAVAQDRAVAKPDADERVTELERIARLRRDGNDAEADKALEEFRRRNPDYRIPEAMWERVRPR